MRWWSFTIGLLVTLLLIEAASCQTVTPTHSVSLDRSIANLDIGPGGNQSDTVIMYITNEWTTEITVSLQVILPDPLSFAAPAYITLSSGQLDYEVPVTITAPERETIRIEEGILLTKIIKVSGVNVDGEEIETPVTIHIMHMMGTITVLDTIIDEDSKTLQIEAHINGNRSDVVNASLEREESVIVSETQRIDSNSDGTVSVDIGSLKPGDVNLLVFSDILIVFDPDALKNAYREVITIPEWRTIPYPWGASALVLTLIGGLNGRRRNRASG